MLWFGYDYVCLAVDRTKANHSLATEGTNNFRILVSKKEVGDEDFDDEDCSVDGDALSDVFSPGADADVDDTVINGADFGGVVLGGADVDEADKDCGCGGNDGDVWGDSDSDAEEEVEDDVADAEFDVKSGMSSREDDAPDGEGGAIIFVQLTRLRILVKCPKYPVVE